MLSMNALCVTNADIDIIFLCDCSGSMSGERIAAVNSAIERLLLSKSFIESLPARISFGVIRFANHAGWHIEPTINLNWLNITETGGVTALGEAITLLSEYLQFSSKRRVANPPVIILLSDGKPTDDVHQPLQNLCRITPLGSISQRYAIGLGKEIDNSVLQHFASPGCCHLIPEVRAGDLHTLLSNCIDEGLLSSLSQVERAGS